LWRQWECLVVRGDQERRDRRVHRVWVLRDTRVRGMAQQGMLAVGQLVWVWDMVWQGMRNGWGER
jgi:hypothetical protein